jgi:polysaccharide export outer membrane protein
MWNRHRSQSFVVGLVVLVASTFATGCQSIQQNPPLLSGEMPRELDKVSLPNYVIEPPDILILDAIRVIPLPPYRIEPMDSLAINVTETLPNEPIQGIITVDPDGTVNLGSAYGSVKVVRKTLEEAKAEIEKYLKTILKNPKVTLALAQSHAMQQLRGEHLVRPDGTVSLGNYGSVHVTGLTIPAAKKAIEQQLANYLYEPEISVDVSGFNSKVYYVVINLAGAGMQIVRQPITGNETVLDALGQVYGLPPIASKDRIWLARPAPANSGCDQVFPVDLRAITECAATATNYQLLPGDRVYVQADPWIATDNTLAKVFAPFERVFGVTLLGSSTIHNVAIRLGQTASGGVGGGF